MFVDELLSYITHFLNNSTIENIRKVVSNFYTIEEVKKSKRLLWDNFKNDLTEYQERKTTENRSAKNAHLDDIFKALKSLDESGKEFKFLSHFNPEEINTTLLLENQVCDILLVQNKLDGFEKRDSNSGKHAISIASENNSLNSVDGSKVNTRGVNQPQRPTL